MNILAPLVLASALGLGTAASAATPGPAADTRPTVVLVLNPLWYAGAFGLGLLAGRAGDRVSLGFMAETERQVERHLEGHLQRLPQADQRSRAVVEQMKADEAAHAQMAVRLGGVGLPAPARAAMRIAAKVMTTAAHYI